MSQNLVGIIVSFTFIFIMIIISTVIQKLFKLSNDFSRKIIHVTVGNWVFIALYYFESWHYAIIMPVAFILINYLSYRFTIIKAMELEEKNPGTIYYVISLAICTVLTYSQPQLLILPFLGIMAMTWGDGLAAVIGKKFPIKQLRARRSLGGTGSFFVFTLIASIVYLLIVGNSMATGTIILISLVTALAGSLIELFSPRNTDNLTVPLIIGIVGFFVGM